MDAVVARSVSRIKDGLARVAIDLTLEGARRIPSFREMVMRHLSDNLDHSYSDTVADVELLALQIWFGRKLKPFLLRLLDERPRAAKKLVHLAYIWSRDVRRRTGIQKGGLVSPVTFVIEPTSRCNLRCPGCYASSTGKGDDPPYEILRRTIVEARDMGVTLVTMSGGEPFLRESKDRAVTRLAAEFPNMGFLVYTNGTMIDHDLAVRLGQLGNVFPAISVEGYERETDARRGKGYYRNATQVREALAEQEVMCGFSATVTRKNADLVSSDEFIDRRIEEGDMFGWYFLMQPIGRAPDPTLFIEPEQRALLRDQIFRWREEGKPIFIGDFWNDGPFVGGCIAGGRYYFHIYANGDISPCVFCPGACGNVKDIISGKSEYRSLSDFINRHPFFVKFREKQREISDVRAPCPLFDNPEKIREVCAQAPWFPANNMPDGYLDGDIAHLLDVSSRQWHEMLRHEALVPACAQGEVAALRERKNRTHAA